MPNSTATHAREQPQRMKVLSAIVPLLCPSKTARPKGWLPLRLELERGAPEASQWTRPSAARPAKQCTSLGVCRTVFITGVSHDRWGRGIPTGHRPEPCLSAMRNAGFAGKPGMAACIPTTSSGSGPGGKYNIILSAARVCIGPMLWSFQPSLTPPPPPPNTAYPPPPSCRASHTHALVPLCSIQTPFSPDPETLFRLKIEKNQKIHDFRPKKKGGSFFRHF